MRIKRSSKRFLVTLLLLAALTCPRAYAAPGVSAVSAVLMEQESGELLFSQNADKPLPIASITKIMTGLLAAERCDPEEEILIRPEWLKVEGSNMGLRPGECCRAEDLLYGLMLESGNDAALALACHMAGDVETFAAWMNDRAAELGMGNTRFRNPHGLTQEGHYSTARDMAVLTCAAMKNPRFAAVVGSKTASAGGHQLRNHNKLLWDYPDALGVKTGYTDAAGRTLVSCARREGMTLVCVTLNDPMDWKDHIALLDWGFSAYTLADTDALSLNLPVISGSAETVSVLPGIRSGLPVRKDGNWEWRVYLPPFLYAPCYAGVQAGRAELYVEDELVFTCPLMVGETVELDPSIPLSFWEKLRWVWIQACNYGYAPPPGLPY